MAIGRNLDIEIFDFAPLLFLCARSPGDAFLTYWATQGGEFSFAGSESFGSNDA